MSSNGKGRKVSNGSGRIRIRNGKGRRAFSLAALVPALVLVASPALANTSPSGPFTLPAENAWTITHKVTGHPGYVATVVTCPRGDSGQAIFGHVSPRVHSAVVYSGHVGARRDLWEVVVHFKRGQQVEYQVRVVCKQGG